MVAVRVPALVDPLRSFYLLVILVFISVTVGLVRIIFFDFSDPFHCQNLSTTGRWIDNYDQKNWQPNGCMTHNYGQADVTTCLSGRNLLFIGDSITRQFYFSFIHLADSSAPLYPNNGEKHADHEYTTRSGIHFHFYWDPFLNSTAAADAFDTFNKNSSKEQPALLVLGSGLWYLRYFGAPDGFLTWEENTDKLFGAIGKNLGSGHPAFDMTVILPVSEVVSSKLSPERSKTLHGSVIEAMNVNLNRHIQLIPSVHSYMSTSGVLLPKVVLPLVLNKMLDPDETDDGLHFSEKIRDLQVNLLLNLRCNDALPKTSPFDKTCCRRYPTPSALRIAVILTVIVWAPIIRFLGRKFNNSTLTLEKTTVYFAVTVGVAAALMFVADRTNLWLKEQKIFDSWTFGLSLIGILGLGLVSVKKADKDLGFLNRQQSDEWKGWMQLCILMYHYSGASRISGIYNPIRVLVASYLFMSGYGHTFYYLSKKSDYGFNRVARILIRLNLFTVILTYAMNTNYDSYYFTPLISLWYLIVYGTLLIGNKFNHLLTFLIGKIFFSVVAVVYLSKMSVLESFFGLLQTFANVHWSAQESAFRIRLDILIVYFGMFTAVIANRLSESSFAKQRAWSIMRRFAVGLSMILLPGYFVFELSLPSKYVYNIWHPYISFLPIFAFLVLRNATVSLRACHSSIFAFVGRCSLETFIIQFHFWLAADTKGILIIIPGAHFRILNFAFTTILFILLSHFVALASTNLTDRISSCNTDEDKCAEIPLSTTADSATINTNYQHSLSNDADRDRAGMENVRLDDFCLKLVQSTLAELFKLLTCWSGHLWGRCIGIFSLIWMLNVIWPE